MIGRLRLRLESLRERLWLRRRERRRAEPPPPAGRARNVIVVKPRDPRFREVIYVLKEEALSDPDCGREELLRQAKAAARRETGEILPAGRRLSLWPAALLLLGALLILKLTGVM